MAFDNLPPAGEFVCELKKLPMVPGRYRYKFVADGLWLWDPQNTEKEPNPYGDFDSVFTV